MRLASLSMCVSLRLSRAAHESLSCLREFWERPRPSSRLPDVRSVCIGFHFDDQAYLQVPDNAALIVSPAARVLGAQSQALVQVVYPSINLHQGRVLTLPVGILVLVALTEAAAARVVLLSHLAHA